MELTPYSASTRNFDWTEIVFFCSKLVKKFRTFFDNQKSTND